jgi:hypothetical protein
MAQTVHQEQNKQVNAWLNWVNNSTGAIMFFNRRSAVLQTLSATNFINWSDNNPLRPQQHLQINLNTGRICNDI